jgi:hypothetical protein
MRQLLIVEWAASLASLPACVVRQVESTPPTVTYAYSAEADYDDIEARADLYCEERYDADASSSNEMPKMTATRRSSPVGEDFGRALMSSLARAREYSNRT